MHASITLKETSHCCSVSVFLIGVLVLLDDFSCVPGSLLHKFWLDFTIASITLMIASFSFSKPT